MWRLGATTGDGLEVLIHGSDLILQKRCSGCVFSSAASGLVPYRGKWLCGELGPWLLVCDRREPCRLRWLAAAKVCTASANCHNQRFLILPQCVIVHVAFDALFRARTSLPFSRFCAPSRPQ